jgi:transcriptional regulator with XRE-family HTH domain
MSSQSKRIKQRRISIGISQEELAYRIGTTQSQVSKYERGVNDFTGDVLAKIADALNTTTDYLLGRTDSPERDVVEDDLDPIESEIVRLLRNQSEDARKQALNVIKAMFVPEAS